jgi:hypothetical protein
MEILKKLFYSFFVSVIFILFHTAIEYFKLSDWLNLILSLSMMLIIQLFAFALLKGYSNGKPLKYHNVFSMLFFTQFFAVILLSLNSAFNPLVENKPINIAEIIISLLIFAGILPLIISAIIWFTIKKNNK